MQITVYASDVLPAPSYFEAVQLLGLPVCSA
jgi:hypothetical protein